jgi:hypothetical protein
LRYAAVVMRADARAIATHRAPNRTAASAVNRFEKLAAPPRPDCAQLVDTKRNVAARDGRDDAAVRGQPARTRRLAAR